MSDKHQEAEMNCYSYVSTKAAWDCTETIFLCAPAAYACSAEKAEEYAELSGWRNTAEAHAAVLIVPVTAEGYRDLDVSWIPNFYDKHKNDFRAPGGVSIPGRDGVVWLWETMIYLAGYEEGAEYAANVLTAHPGFFAASLLHNGKITDYTNADKEAAHWFVRTPHDYTCTNREIPSAVWLSGTVDPETRKYFETCAHTDTEAQVTYGGICTEVHCCSGNPAQQIRVSEEMPSSDTVMDTFFGHTLRWKNGPDGQLRNYLGKKDYAVSERFVHYCAQANGNDYPYTVYLPEGLTKEDAAGLPVVFSIHGRGEPSWVFAEKNGWQVLADETKEFITVFPDSPYNIWLIDRDTDAIKAIAAQVLENYKADPERIYLSGFSNGAVFTSQQASTFPECFAAASPWNGPSMSIKIDRYVYKDTFAESGYEMPFWIVVGDSDSKAGADREPELDIILRANHCERSSEEIWNGENHYTEEAGFAEGNRFHTRVFRNSEGSVRVGLTVMKNMPHGAIWDESRAAWAFMKRFRRPAGSKTVEEITEE